MLTVAEVREKYDDAIFEYETLYETDLERDWIDSDYDLFEEYVLDVLNGSW